MLKTFQSLLFRNCKLERFEPGELIFRQGDKGDKLYIVLEGTVDILRTVVSNEKVVNRIDQHKWDTFSFAQTKCILEPPLEIYEG